MKKIFISYLIAIWSFYCFSQQGWVKQTTNTFKQLHGIYFINADTGWAVGDNGTALKTHDGGETWNSFTTPLTNEIFSVYFRDYLHGCITGWGTIIYTEDGGSNWQYASKPSPVYPTHQHFADSLHAWVTCLYGKILQTIDGGKTWVDQETGTTETLYHIHFLDTLRGFACGSFGTLLKTVDGGDHWTHSADTLYRTKNGGESWNKIKVVSYLSDLYFHDSITGYLVSGNGDIFITTDGGDSWNPQNSNTTAGINQIFFLDKITGWLAGTSGTILHTDIGGCDIPARNLGKDTAICQNDILLLDAGDGVYSYLWNNDSAERFLEVTSTGTYSVTVTNQCGFSNSDTINILVNPLPDKIDLGPDTAFCDGGTVILDAGSGYQYTWSDGSANQTLTVYNTGTYIGTITDVNNCSNGDTINIVVHPLPDVSLGNNTHLCEGESIALNAGSDLVYIWDDNSTDQFREVSETGKYFVKVTDGNQCENSDTIEVFVYPIPHIEINPDGSTKLCKGEIVNLNTNIINNDGISDYQFIWNDSQLNTTSQLQVDTSGIYQVTVSEDHGCTGDAEIEIRYQYPFEDEEIGLVTVDTASGDNLVVWERTPDKGTEYYKIYRGPDGNELYLDSVDYHKATICQDIGTWDDGISYRYKITVVDTCGNESFYSSSHKTMHLTASVGVAGEVNLSWNHYEGFPVAWYYIYRGIDSTQLHLYDSIQYDPTTTAKTDYNPPVGVAYYRIGVKAPKTYVISDLTKAGTGPYSHSMSNIEDNRLQGTGIKNINSKPGTIMVYPNPFTDKTTIRFHNSNNAVYQLKVRDLSGKLVRQPETVTGSEIELSGRNLSPGCYFIEITGDQVFRGKIILE